MKFPTSWWTQKFITVTTRTYHWTLSWARYIKYTTSHPTFKTHFNIILLPLSRSSKMFLSSRFSNQNFINIFLSCRLHSAHLIFLNLRLHLNNTCGDACNPIFDDILNYKTALRPAASSQSTLKYHNIKISVSVLLSIYLFNFKTSLYPHDLCIFGLFYYRGLLTQRFCRSPTQLWYHFHFCYILYSQSWQASSIYVYTLIFGNRPNKMDKYLSS